MLTTHLELAVKMYAQIVFTLQAFLFDAAIISWNVKKDCALDVQQLASIFKIQIALDFVLCLLHCYKFCMLCYNFIYLLVCKNFPIAAARVHGDQGSIPLVKPRLGKRILFLFMSTFFCLELLQVVLFTKAFSSITSKRKKWCLVQCIKI